MHIRKSIGRQAILALLGGVALLSGVSRAAPPAPEPSCLIPHVDGITVDGDTTDWGDRGERINVLSGWPARRDAADSDAQVRLGWDARGLLVLADVTDRAPQESDQDDALWNGDAVELFLTTGGDRPRYVTVTVAPGLDPRHPRLRWKAYDDRPAPLSGRPVTFEAAAARTAHGYTLEERLPWDNFAIAPRAGTALRLQVAVDDQISPSDRLQGRWYPNGGIDAKGDGMNAITLSDGADSPQDVTATAEYEDFRYARIDVVAVAALAGQRATLSAAGRALAAVTLAAQDGRAVGQLTVPVDLARGAPADWRLAVGAASTALALPDPAPLRRQALEQTEITISPFVFSGSALPRPQIAHPGLLRDLAGDCRLDVRYFDTGAAPVSAAERPGRYGAAVTLAGPDGAVLTRRLYTLYRRPGDMGLDDDSLQYGLALPAEAGVDPVVVAEQQPNVSHWAGDLMAGPGADLEDTARLLACLHERARGDAPSRRNGAYQSDERFRYAVRRRLGLLPPLKSVVVMPPGYQADPSRHWPLIINLHGNWPRTADSLDIPAQEAVVVSAREHRRPYIVLAPLCPPDQDWPVAGLEELLRDTQAKYRVDPDRIILTGGSMGGITVWDWAAERPDLFAAAVPCCTIGDPRDAATLRRLPIWAFHGVQDPYFPIAQVRQSIAQMQAGGVPVRLTEFPDLGHDIGATTFARPDLWDWIARQRRPHSLPGR